MRRPPIPIYGLLQPKMKRFNLTSIRWSSRDCLLSRGEAWRVMGVAQGYLTNYTLRSHLAAISADLKDIKALLERG